MPTELRAALRDIAENLTDATLDADPEADAGNHEEAHEYLHLAIGPAVKRLRALADAPPTVAELVISLPAPKTGAPRMAVEWTWPVNGLTFRARRSGSFGLVVERNEGGAVGWRPVKGLCHADLTAPARLVEVTP